MPNTYYIYVAYLDGIPRYVGAGHGLRFEHVNSGTSHNRKLNYVVLAENRVFEIEFLKKNLEKIDAFVEESKFVTAFGLECDGTGTLYNETYGGRGFSMKHAASTRKTIGVASRRRWEMLRADPEAYHAHIEKLKRPNAGQFCRGRNHSDSWHGGAPKHWTLHNEHTGETISFTNRTAYVREHPELQFARTMRPEQKYSKGPRRGWVLKVSE